MGDKIGKKKKQAKGAAKPASKAPASVADIKPATARK
ncbi:malic enzyme [Sulfitobacter sp. PS-8MA]